MQPDLRGADLRLCNLGEADLSNTLLTESELRGANLASSNLRSADLGKANLNSAILCNADLRAACLVNADLREIQVHDGLGGAAIVDDANFEGARFTRQGEGDAWNGFLELSCAIGLHKARFSDAHFLSTYLATVVEYTRNLESPEARRYPSFFADVIRRIDALREIVGDFGSPPDSLVQSVRLVREELIAYLRKEPQALYGLRPRQFEELIANILSGYGWSIELAAPVRDGGYDILCVSKDESGIPTSWIVECKRYDRNKLVGVDVLRSLYAVKTDKSMANALIATTSHFTRGAHEYKSSKYDLALRDYEGIVEWIEAYSGKRGSRWRGRTQNPRKVFEGTTITWSGIFAFERLINEPKTTEAELQRFFEGHPEFLFPGMSMNVNSRVVLTQEGGHQLVPDFILTNAQTGYACIVELKSPSLRTMTRSPYRNRLTAAVLEASSQLQQYRTWFDRAENRRLIHSRLGVEVHRPVLVLVIGRSTEVNTVLRTEGEMAGITILTYDYLVERAKQHAPRGGGGGGEACE